MNRKLCTTLGLPYPKADPGEKNLMYARGMLDNAGGTISEMNAIALYTYNGLISCDAELKCVFEEIAETEMRHLTLFLELAWELGEEPRLWSQSRMGKKYWSPGYIIYAKDTLKLLGNAMSNERAFIRKYQEQLKTVDNKNIREILTRILADEELHLKVFAELLEERV